MDIDRKIHLLKKLKASCISSADDGTLYGLCGEIWHMGLAAEAEEFLLKLISQHGPPASRGEDIETGYLWPRGFLQPRIQFIDELILKFKNERKSLQ